MKLSLKWRIALIGIIPLVGLNLLVFSNMYSDWDHLNNTSQAIDNFLLVDVASEVIHETQTERGSSVGYLGGGISLEKLTKQRLVNDKKIALFKEAIPKSHFDEIYKQKLIDTVDRLSNIRGDISSKEAPTGEVIKTYSGVITTLIRLAGDTSNKAQSMAFRDYLRSLIILEESKEYGGILRANLTSVFSKNEPVDQKKYMKIVDLKSGIAALLKSKVLLISKEGQEIIDNFFSSSEWSFINKSFFAMTEKRTTGQFGVDASVFFDKITAGLNYLGKTVVQQKSYIKSEIEMEYSNTKQSLITSSLIMGGLVLVLIFVVLFSVRGIVQALGRAIESLTDQSKKLGDVSVKIAGSSSELSQASNKQSSNLQETVTAINQISAMVDRNAESSEVSKGTSKQSQNAVTSGKETVDNMVSAMEGINICNNNIMSQMETSNKEISDIVQVISEIGDKTKVINDIVFQTKLLSFNASVEAARAGEHGKGFAVVAEEVGNLAQMSGTASTEISQMLADSIGKVKKIVVDNKGQVETLIGETKSKVELGRRVADDCGHALDEILKNVTSVNDSVNEIASASQEQSKGVQNINESVTQLDDLTQQNTTAAAESNELANVLETQVNQMNDVVGDLLGLLYGKAMGNNTTSAHYPEDEDDSETYVMSNAA